MTKNIIADMLVFIFFSGVSIASGAENSVRLEELDLTHVHHGWGKPVANATVVNKPLTLAGKMQVQKHYAK